MSSKSPFYRHWIEVCQTSECAKTYASSEMQLEQKSTTVCKKVNGKLNSTKVDAATPQVRLTPLFNNLGHTSTDQGLIYARHVKCARCKIETGKRSAILV